MKNNNHTFKRVVACVMVVIMAVAAVPLSGFVGLELPRWSEMFATRVNAYYTEGNYEYIVENGEATITYCDRSISGDVVIPDTLGGYPVTSIGYQAFYGCNGLTNVTIPDSVSSISSDAFADTAWYNAYPFGDVYAGKVYYKYKGTMLENTSVVIKKGTKGIAGSAFSNCDGLTSITIPDSVTSVGDSAFFLCRGLKNITIPGSVTSIGDNAFYYCTGLTGITIPDSVTSIGKGAFADCIGFTHITIPDSVTELGSGAFGNCTNLTSVTIGNGIKTIYSSWAWCKGTFENCPLTIIKIGKNVKIIEKDAFKGIKSIPEIYYAGSEADWKKISIDPSNDMILRAKMYYNADITHTHSYTSKITKKATCTADGVTTYTCTCGDSYTKSIPATGKHINTTTTTKATTAKDGKTVTACTVCGKVSKTTPIYKASSIKLSAVSYTYNAKVQRPTVTVKNSKGTTLKNGTDYTVAYSSGCKNPGKYAVKVTFKGNYSGSKTLYFTILPGITSSIATATNSSAIKLTWKAVPGATGYRVFQYDAKTKKYVTVKTLTGTSCTVSKLKSGTTYKFAVRAYSTVNGTVYWASGYKTVTATTNPGTPTLSVTAGAKKATLKWTKRAEATGYVVYMATSKTGKYTKIATIKNNGTVSMTKTGLTTGKTYYFKVAAYKTVSGKVVYSGWSAVKGVKIK